MKNSMNKKFYILVITLPYFSINSQPSISWQHTYLPLQGQGYKSSGISVCPADGNNFYLVGALYYDPYGSIR